MSDTRDHWRRVYASTAETAVSWYRTHLDQSLKLIRSTHPDTSASIIDVGGGESTLVDDLLAAGYADVTVLDIAETALARTRARLGERGREVIWLEADVTAWQPPRTWCVWHDRAVFHFLTTPDQQHAYIAALKSGTHAGSVAILATFALDGPETCSGLPVQRYSAETLAHRLGRDFRLIRQTAERHTTPRGVAQGFTYAVLERVASTSG